MSTETVSTQSTWVSRFTLFLRQVVAELRKVIWPTRRELVSYVVIVLVFLLAVGTFVAVTDFLVTKLAFQVFG